MKTFLLVSTMLCVALMAGCTRHRVTVDPIYATIDINIKIDNRLDEFWAFEEELSDDKDAEDTATSSTTESSPN